MPVYLAQNGLAKSKVEDPARPHGVHAVEGHFAVGWVLPPARVAP